MFATFAQHLRFADLSRERGVMELVAAIGQQGCLNALVDKVLRRGALGFVVVVPGVVSGGDGGGILVGQGECFGAEAVFEGITAGSGFAVVGFGAGGMRGILAIDRGTRLRGQRHR